MEQGVSMITSTVAKTVSRFVAENSLISAMAYIVAVAAAHYYLTDEPQEEMEKDIMEKGSPGAIKLYNMLQKYHGPDVHICYVKPYFIMSSDETVLYAIHGVVGEKPKFVLVDNFTNTNSHINAPYLLDQTKAFNGLRVRSTYTFTATEIWPRFS